MFINSYTNIRFIRARSSQ